MKVPKFQNLSERDGKVCTEDAMVWISWAWRTLSACIGSATVVLWVHFCSPSCQPHVHWHTPSFLKGTVSVAPEPPWALDTLPVTLCWPEWAVLQAPTLVWDPHGFHQDLSLWSRHTDTGTGKPTPLPHLLLAPSSISTMGTNAAKDFPSNPCLKITLGCGRKASRLTLPHAALF